MERCAPRARKPGSPERRATRPSGGRHGLSAKVKELEARAEMAESNLRTLLAAAKGAGRDATLGDTEMEAILGVLKGEAAEPVPEAAEAAAEGG